MHSLSAATVGDHDDVQRTDTRRSTRIRSSAIGAAVGALVGALPLAVGATDPDGLATLVVAGLVGAPVGAVLGWRTAAEARAVTSRQGWTVVAAMAIKAVILGDLAISAYLAAGAFSSDWAFSAGDPGLLQAVAGFVFVFVAGLLIYGLPALMLTIPAAIVWIVIVRAIPARLLDSRRSVVVST